MLFTNTIILSLLCSILPYKPSIQRICTVYRYKCLYVRMKTTVAKPNYYIMLCYVMFIILYYIILYTSILTWLFRWYAQRQRAMIRYHNDNVICNNELTVTTTTTTLSLLPRILTRINFLRPRPRPKTQNMTWPKDKCLGQHLFHNVSSSTEKNKICTTFYSFIFNFYMFWHLSNEQLNRLRRSQDFVWGARFFTKKLTTFLVVAVKTDVNTT